MSLNGWKMDHGRVKGQSMWHFVEYRDVSLLLPHYSTAISSVDLTLVYLVNKIPKTHLLLLSALGSELRLSRFPTGFTTLLGMITG